MKKNKNILPLIPLEEWSKQFTKEGLKAAEKRINYEETVKCYKVVQQLKKIRKELKLTQQQVADKAEINRSIVAKVESGQRNATLNTLMRLAKAMGKELKVDFV
ncbi:MAG: helix-turn-helix transcriptional regulator [Candidatus Pacebacteria bacterium]|nr:helix-turn-helix transcriptional regulator [Candidatus Paceibacterota bacterium]